jgi:hypothetical protein
MRKEWTIDSLTFHRAERKSREGMAEPCFKATLVQSLFDEPTAGWTKTEADVFTFKSGSIAKVGQC